MKDVRDVRREKKNGGIVIKMKLKNNYPRSRKKFKSIQRKQLGNSSQ